MSTCQPRGLFTAAQSRAVDRCAIQQFGLAGPVLMARAARAAFQLLLERLPKPELVQVLCGPGNNGGDGLLLAQLAIGKGIPTRIFLVDGEPRSPDAALAAQKALAAGLRLEVFEPDLLSDSGVVVDAMLGTGIKGNVRESYSRAIRSVNSLGAPVLALDVPSGVNSDTGATQGEAIAADWTMSFITAKRGLYTGDGAVHAGQRSLDDLEVPAEAFAIAGPGCPVLQLDAELAALPARLLSAHKGRLGRCLLVGGDHGMGGAIILAAEAALRTGVGLAQVATRAETLAPLLTRIPECLAKVVEHRNMLEPLLDDANAIVLGPGLGQDAWGEQMLHAALASGKPLLLDADALNLLAVWGQRALPQGSVITPHPGEAARLLGCSTQAVQADRFAAAAQLANDWRVSVVLKGNGSLVHHQSVQGICTLGNPGMASGGMGDVLSGIIGGLLAQGQDAGSAARLGTLLHARAGDIAAADTGQCALLASDLFRPLASLLP